MTGLTHRVLGAEVGLGVASVGAAIHHLALAGIPIVVGAMALGMLAAQLPDWDLRLGIPHRGPTHSVVVALALTLLVTIATYALLLSAFVLVVVVVGLALASHLLADLTNRTPMALLWPIRRGRIRPKWLPAVREGTLEGAAVEATAIFAFGSLALVGILSWVRL